MTILELQNVLGDTIKAVSSPVEDDQERAQAYSRAEVIARLAKQMVNAADVVLRADKLCSRHDRIDYLVGTIDS